MTDRSDLTEERRIGGGASYHILQNQLHCLREELSVLVEKWQEEAVQARTTAPPHLSTDPHIAYGQTLNRCAEELGDVVLEFDD